MHRNSIFFAAAATCLFADAANAASVPLTSMEKNIETIGTATAIAMPLAAGAFSFYKKDRIGLEQLATETVLTVGTAWALKQFVREQRPDGSDFHSFPVRDHRPGGFRIVLHVGTPMAGNMACPHPCSPSSSPIRASRPSSIIGTTRWQVPRSRPAMGYFVTTRYRRSNFYTDLRCRRTARPCIFPIISRSRPAPVGQRPDIFASFDLVKEVPIPFSLSKNDRDRRGLPIPFIVYRDTLGVPHFTVDDIGKLDTVLLNKLCGLCGQPLKLGQMWLIGGPASAFLEDGLFIEPPAHEECARYAIQVCPFIAASNYSRRIRKAKTLKPGVLHDQAQIHDNQWPRRVRSTLPCCAPPASN